MSKSTERALTRRSTGRAVPAADASRPGPGGAARSGLDPRHGRATNAAAAHGPAGPQRSAPNAEPTTSPGPRPTDTAGIALQTAQPTSDAGGDLDVERDSDVPISTQIFWQVAYQIDSGRLLPGERLPPVRELGAALRVNPNTIRAVYRRLADAGYVTSRHGAGTHIADRPPQRRGASALAGLVAETLRRAASAGFTPDEVAAATFAAATERRRPGPLVRVLFAECTKADAGYDAERIAEAFPSIESEGALLEEIPDRLQRFHYDIVATTTFHADEAQAYVGGRVPVVAMFVGPAYMELVHEVVALPPGARVGVVCKNERGANSILETLELAGVRDVDIMRATPDDPASVRRVDETADLILMSRDAIEANAASTLSRHERIREWTYDFDPAGIELLRRSIEHVQATRGADSAVHDA